MYEFLDTNQHAVATLLPTEAVSINGKYLEDIVDGYRTLYVKGRESLGAVLNTYSVGTADGARIKGRRYPARVLTVGFQMLCDNSEDFRLRFNQLNNILSVEEADFIFHDEPDKFFTGYPIMDASIEEGRNNVTGEWKIYCTYPFKRSVDTVTLSSTDANGVVVGNNSATFTFDYDGVMPAKPLLRCKFASAKSGGNYNEDGDCGYVAFLNQSEKIVQLGNPEVMDVDATNKNSTLINKEFISLNDWTNDGMSITTITDPNWGEGAGQTGNYVTGTGSLSKTTQGAVNFKFNIVHRLCVSSPSQTGSFKVSLKNNDAVVVGFSIEKTGSGTTATVNYILGDTVVGTDYIDVSQYNVNFGLCNRTPLYVSHNNWAYIKDDPFMWDAQTIRRTTRSWRFSQSNLNSGITRNGNAVTFTIGELASRTFKMAGIEGITVYDVVFEMTGDFYINALGSVSLIQKKGVAFAEIPNVFTAGDVVEADCNSANVYLYRAGTLLGHLEPQYGALGNDWEDFEIKVGQNVIRAVWSDWVNTNYKPTIEIIFNKVYL